MFGLRYCDKGMELFEKSSEEALKDLFLQMNCRQLDLYFDLINLFVVEADNVKRFQLKSEELPIEYFGIFNTSLERLGISISANVTEKGEITFEPHFYYEGETYPIENWDTKKVYCLSNEKSVSLATR